MQKKSRLGFLKDQQRMAEVLHLGAENSVAEAVLRG